MISAVYEIRNLVNGKRYVGSAMNLKKRRREHLGALRSRRHRNWHLQAAFSKYGESAFVFSVLEHTEVSQLILREQYHLDTLSPAYNILPIAGSRLGRRHTPEARAKMSAAKRGKPNPHRGWSPDEQTRRKISAAHTGQRNHNFGKRHSERTRRKISEALMGERNPNYGKHRSPSDETRRKMSIAQKARWRRVRLARSQETGEAT